MTNNRILRRHQFVFHGMDYAEMGSQDSTDHADSVAIATSLLPNSWR
jgi:hypothetical protein